MLSRPHLAVLSLPLLMMSAGCRVEQTPDEYFERGRSAEGERDAAAQEIRDRLLAFIGAAERGNATEALLALSPAGQIDLVAPAGLEVAGGGAIRAALAHLLATPVSVMVREVEVRAGASGGVAWFRMLVEAPGVTREPSLYSATGTYLMDAGRWELVQAHISGPVRTDSLPSNPPDSAAIPAGAE